MQDLKAIKEMKYENRVLELRKARDMSLIELSDKTKISVMTINNFERGKLNRHPINYIDILAKTFEVQPEEMFKALPYKIKRWTPEQLAKKLAELGASKAEFSRITGITPGNLSHFFAGNRRQTIEDDMVYSAAMEQLEAGERQPPVLERHREEARGNVVDLPVRSTQPAGVTQPEATASLPVRLSKPHGDAMLIEDTVIEHVPAIGLAGVSDAWCVYVQTMEAEPRYMPGDLVCVHPYQPPRPGDYVLRKEGQQWHIGAYERGMEGCLRIAFGITR